MFGISKEQVAALPTVSFPGRTILIDNVADARAAMTWLAKQPMVGFDTETRPSFKKGCLHKPSLMQLSTTDDCFLLRLNHIGLTEPLIEFLQNENIVKIGLSVNDDFRCLHRIAPFNPGGFIELQNYVKQFGIADNSLQKIYAIIFNGRISKAQRLTNWEAEHLTDAQQAYAALDAWACMKIYNYLREGHFNPESCPYILTPTDTDSTK